MNRRTVLAACTLIAVCGCSTSTQTFPGGSLPARGLAADGLTRPAAQHHLYVASFPLGSGTNGLERFPMVDGIPAQTPDLVYTNATGPITIGPDGSLYAVDGLWVKRFAPGKTRPMSKLRVKPCGRGYIYNGVTGLAFDVNGYLYADVDEGISGLGPNEGIGKCGGDTVVIYPPNATGHTKPVRKIPVELGASAPGLGLAIDQSGDLAVTRWQNNVVRVYKNPITNPRLARFFYSRKFNGPEGIAFDPVKPVVYLGNRIPPSIVVVPADANGQTRALREIKNPNAQHFCGQIALFGKYLFVADEQTQTVYEYLKDSRGTPTPVATVTVPYSACGVAVD